MNNINNSKIHVMSPELANLIAAGEVVERPASVVKELVENSIDAGSTKIKVELTDCGLKKITVLDNGCGMEEEDIPLAILPHATSKIYDENDLFKITTLGFRGEALPSIASVAEVRITSSTTGNGGYYYLYSYGKEINSGLASLPKGTMVEVSNLFHNTPARLKHLGSIYQELSSITDYFYKSALSHPNIAFTLTNNNKQLFKSSGNNEIKEIMMEAYGSSITKSLIYFEGQNTLYKIYGYTTNNEVFRSNRSSMTIIVNGRVIRNLALIYAIDDAYQTILTTGKHPITTLFIEVDPTLIDVNVHPSKLEIRLTDELKLKALITNTIALAIKEQELLKFKKEEISKTEDFVNNLENDENLAYEIPKINTSDDLWALFEEDEKNETTNSSTQTLKNDFVFEEEQIQEETKKIEQIKFKTENRSFFKQLNFIGRFHETYLLLEDENTLYLLDQHAAMERIMYEKISNDFAKTTHSCYDLLVPLTMEFSVKEKIQIMENIDSLTNLGITLEEFGNNTIIIRSIPTWIPNGLETEFIHDIIQHIVIDAPINKSVMYDSLAKKLSCKKSIKAGMHIRLDEVKSLLTDLDKCEMPYTCPHGRPTMIKFTNYEVEKLFKRVI
ncbi:MAG: DNA mismatch repair endonuclease MutL [Bacilli bacterium]|nr:DNA mismatch repair endonuclease MutL [Bacilli bacterium]